MQVNIIAELNDEKESNYMEERLEESNTCDTSKFDSFFSSISL
jgi:hypothetical protein